MTCAGFTKDILTGREGRSNKSNRLLNVGNRYLAPQRMPDRKYIRFQLLVVLVGAVVMAVKFFAFFITSSNAILSDALESIINVVAGSFALYSLILASKPKDRDHPYGHGKIEFISAGIEGTLILVAGGVIITRSVMDLLGTPELTSLDTGLYLSAGAGLINYLLGFGTEHYGKKYRSPTMIASGKHLKSDGYTSVGLIVGLTTVLLTGWIWLDSLIAMGFGAYIGLIGFREIRKSVAGIMDEADFELLHALIAKIENQRTPNWIDLHNLRAQRFGKALHVDCHMTLPYYFTVREAHHELDKVEALIAAHHPDEVEMFIHADPCEPTSCRICSKSDCPVRSHPHQERITWELSNVLKNRQHE